MVSRLSVDDFGSSRISYLPNPLSRLEAILYLFYIGEGKTDNRINSLQFSVFFLFPYGEIFEYPPLFEYSREKTAPPCSYSGFSQNAGVG